MLLACKTLDNSYGDRLANLKQKVEEFSAMNPQHVAVNRMDDFVLLEKDVMQTISEMRTALNTASTVYDAQCTRCP